MGNGPFFKILDPAQRRLLAKVAVQVTLNIATCTQNKPINKFTTNSIALRLNSFNSTVMKNLLIALLKQKVKQS